MTIMNFGFLLFPDVEELDFLGPWEIIGTWSEKFDGPSRRLLVSQAGGPDQRSSWRPNITRAASATGRPISPLGFRPTCEA